MKSEKTESNKKTTKTYPYLGELKREGVHIIVLFIKPRAGTIVHIFKDHTAYLGIGFGQYADNWSEDEYKVLEKEERIILSNE